MNAVGGALLYWAAVIALMLEVRRELLDDTRRAADPDGGRRPRRRWVRITEGVLVLAVLGGLVLTAVRLHSGG